MPDPDTTPTADRQWHRVTLWVKGVDSDPPQSPTGLLDWLRTAEYWVDDIYLNTSHMPTPGEIIRVEYTTEKENQ